MKHTLITNWLVFHYLLIRSFLYSHQFNSNQLNYLLYLCKQGRKPNS